MTELLLFVAAFVLLLLLELFTSTLAPPVELELDTFPDDELDTLPDELDDDDTVPERLPDDVDEVDEMAIPPLLPVAPLKNPPKKPPGLPKNPGPPPITAGTGALVAITGGAEGGSGTG